MARSEPPASTKASKSCSFNLNNPWQNHTQKIIVACSLTVLPMVAFTLTLLWIVFAYAVDLTNCPVPELCPKAGLNAIKASHYYIDFPAGRLAFISSWLFTVSLALVGVLVTMYGYQIARQLLYASNPQEQNLSLPSPYQLSTLVRLINAEVLSLLDLAIGKTKNVFWKLEQSTDVHATRDGSRALQSCVAVFCIALISSAFIQAADTYLHIAVETVEVIQISSDHGAAYNYSGVLAPWCFKENHSLEAYDNLTFYGCAFALARPPAVDDEIDWKASTFGVSTKCSAIPPAMCDIEELEVDPTAVLQPRNSFSCTKERAGISVAGYITTENHITWFEDWHRYLKEGRPFDQRSIKLTSPKSVLNATTSANNHIFNNPWHWIAQVVFVADKLGHDVIDESLQNGQSQANDSRLWQTPFGIPFFFLSCNSTVWDMTYTAVNQRVTWLSRTESNSTTTGIASMPNVHALTLSVPLLFTAAMEAGRNGDSTESFIRAYELAMSKVFTFPFYPNIAPAPAHLVQRRTSKLVTRLPSLALWLLVAANLNFAVLAMVLATLAYNATSPDVHQVHIRLGIAGFVSELFDKLSSKRAVKNEEGLFEENTAKAKGKLRNRKKIAVRITREGGAEFVEGGIPFH